jgi:ubiquinone/menaquinone biosynthesis C-methylase UbiE
MGIMKDAMAPLDLGQIERVDAVIAMLGSLEDSFIVDLGCGEGQVARALAARGARVVGYDPFIAEEVGWTREGTGEYRLARATAEAVPELDGSADAVLFVYSLHHVPQAGLGAALHEAHRLLKPTGRLCVVEPVAQGPLQYVMELFHDETTVRQNAIIALTEHAAPMFEDQVVAVFNEYTEFADFDAYAARSKLSMRFNDYTTEQVTASAVQKRFEEVAAINQGRFDQPVRINLFSRPRDAR